MYIVELNETIDPERLPGFAQAAAKVFKTTPERMERLLSNSTRQLSKPLPREKAEQMASAFRRLGVTVHLVAVLSEAETSEVSSESASSFQAAEVSDEEVVAHTFNTEVAATRRLRRQWPDYLLGIALVALVGGVIATLLSGRPLLPIGQSNPVTVEESTPLLPQVAQPEPTDETINNGAIESEAVLIAPSMTEGSLTDNESNSSAIRSENSPSEASNETTNVQEAATSEPEIFDLDLLSNATAQEATNDSSLEEARETEPVSSSTADSTVTTPEDTATEASVAILPELEVSVSEISDSGESSSSNDDLVDGAVEETTPDNLVQNVASQPGEVTEAELGGEAVTLEETGETLAESNTIAVLSDLDAGKYIQTGAYSNLENAAYQKEVLENLGFNVSQAQDFQFVVLLAGPFTDANLNEATATLRAEGISHYVRELP